MEHRQRAQVTVVFAHERQDEAVRVVPERRVRGTDALRRPRRARRVDQAEVVPRLDRARERRTLLGGTVEHLLHRQRAPGQLHRRGPADGDDRLEARQAEARQPLDELVVRDEHLRLSEVQRVLEERPACGEVERRVDGAGGVRSEPGAEDVGAGRHPRGDVVAHLDAEALEAVAGAPGLAHGVRARPLLLLEQDEELVGVGGRACREEVGDDALLARREWEV